MFPFFPPSFFCFRWRPHAGPRFSGAFSQQQQTTSADSAAAAAASVRFQRLRALSTYEKTYVVRHHFQNTSVVYRTVLLEQESGEDDDEEVISEAELRDALAAMQKRHTALRSRIVAVKPRGRNEEGAFLECGDRIPRVLFFSCVFSKPISGCRIVSLTPLSSPPFSLCSLKTRVSGESDWMKEFISESDRVGAPDGAGVDVFFEQAEDPADFRIPVETVEVNDAFDDIPQVRASL